MVVGSTSLLDAVTLTRQMLQHAEDKDWEALQSLVPRRDAALQGLKARAEDREHWEEMHQLNQRVVALVDAFRAQTIAEESVSRRQADAAAKYLKGGR